jgi:hypothetical protein
MYFVHLSLLVRLTSPSNIPLIHRFWTSWLWRWWRAVCKRAALLGRGVRRRCCTTNRHDRSTFCFCLQGEKNQHKFSYVMLHLIIWVQVFFPSTQAVCRRLVTTRAWFRSWPIYCGNFCWPNDNGTGIFSSSFLQKLDNHVCFIQQQQWTNLTIKSLFNPLASELF